MRADLLPKPGLDDHLNRLAGIRKTRKKKQDALLRQGKARATLFIQHFPYKRQTQSAARGNIGQRIK